MFYILRYIDEFDSGIPMGYEAGVVDEFNLPPEGSQIVETESELNQLMAQYDQEDADFIEPDIKSNNGNNGQGNG